LGLWPTAVPFPSAEGGASPELDEIVQGPAAALTAVALVAGPKARASGWAAQAAVELARRWRGPRRVILVDLGLDAPSLHAAAGVSNDEGVVDVVEYGISLNVVRQSAADGAFDIVTTGAWITDAAAVLRAPAWSRVFVEVAQQRGTLLAYVPADADGMDEVARRAGAVLVLAEPEESGDIVGALPDAYAVLAVLTPPGAPLAALDAPEEPVVVAAGFEELTTGTARADERGSAPAVEPEGAPPAPPGATTPVQETPRLTDEEFDRIRLPTDREARDALIADLRERQRAARLSPPADSELAAQAERAEPPGVDGAAMSAVRLPPNFSEHALDGRVETMGDDVALETLPPAHAPVPAARSGYRTPLIWTISVVLIVSLVAGAWRLLAGRLGIGTPAQPVPAAVQEPAPTVPPEPAAAEVHATELPFAVAMSAHSDLADAMRRLDVLGREGDLAFHITPLERDGTLYYHIMAGPVADSASAVALRQDLVARRLKTAATPTDLRRMPLAFLVGDYGSTEAAADAMADLRRLDVPGYMVPSEAADGAIAYRVYVGGFSSEAEAEVTRQLLRSAGVRDSLVTRTGSTSR
jgi:hypothetical protein